MNRLAITKNVYGGGRERDRSGQWQKKIHNPTKIVVWLDFQYVGLYWELLENLRFFSFQNV
jgi:hypothetical protein